MKLDNDITLDDNNNSQEETTLLDPGSRPTATERRENIISTVIIGTVLFAALLALIFGIVFRYSDIDYIVENAVVHTMTNDNKTFCCFAVRNGKFELITETKEEMQKAYPRPKKVIDAKGAAILPGFIDGHAVKLPLKSKQQEDYITSDIENK